MNLRNRSLLILGLTFFVFFIIIAAVSLSVTLSGLDRIEYQDVAKSVTQTRSALSAESAALLSTGQDWGFWDDMYQYAADRNQAFIERNTDPAALATIRLNLFMILDNKGTILHSQSLSSDYEPAGEVPAVLAMLIQSDPRIVNLPEDSPGISGILLTPEGPMVIASVPIIRSDRSGPVHGTVVMGRYLEYGPLQQVTDLTGYYVTFFWPEKGGPVKDLPVIPESRAGQPGLALVVENESWVTGYTTMRDLAGREMVMGVSMDRDLYRTGFANITTYLLLLALWAVMTGIIVVVVMDRTVLRRMGMLTDHVRSLSARPGADPAPVLTGDDELADLEKTILTSRMDLHLSEQQLRVFVNAMPGPAALFSREGTFLLINKAFADYLNRRPEEVKGTDIRSYFPAGQIEKYERVVSEAIRKKEPVHLENDIQGKTFLMSYYPVLGTDGEVIQLGFLSFDISERKRLENALQRVTKKISLLNTVIFTDIQNKVFVQMGYLELARQTTTDIRQKSYLEKQEDVVREIQSSLSFARQFNDMGMNPPRWQNVQEVILFAVSHLDLGSLAREFNIDGLEIYADPLLERVFVTLVENTIMHAPGATVIRAGYSLAGDEAVIVVEDNGPGIAGDKKESVFSKGVGAGGATSLFLSREILSITGITIRETGVFGSGARFEIRVPKGSYRLLSR